MIFNSLEFIFIYLPITLFGFFLAAKKSNLWAIIWLVCCSLFFYGWWNPKFTLILIFSISFNYGMGYAINHSRDILSKTPFLKILLAVALILNIALLCYFKYTHFFVNFSNEVFNTQWTLNNIILPLGISFFTFTQCAFLIDTYRGDVKDYNFINYLLFVSYFPHLMAGPILHHKEMMPQFSRTSTYRLSAENLSVGITIFILGLFKKVVIADSIGVYVGPVFSAPAAGIELNFFQAWGGALCFTLQLYFDFSGYSDMAIGLSRLFGIALPLNFCSPYKSSSLIQFWGRWHITLSRFLKQYLYIPLGGNRKGKLRCYLNLMTVMLLGGFWHGAGWTFILWGGLHGFYLLINHGWKEVKLHITIKDKRPIKIFLYPFSVLITFIAVVIGWVVFRADNIHSIIAILSSMFALNGILQGSPNQLIGSEAIIFIISLLVLVWFAPNTQQIMSKYEPALNYEQDTTKNRLQWSPSFLCGFIISILGFLSIIFLSNDSPFLYFQF